MASSLDGADGTLQLGGIKAITVRGFKSIRDPSEIAIHPLTILAGANSTGKSSAVQPLLLLKQTLDAPHDPGALKLDGPNVSFTSFDQLLWKPGTEGSADSFSIRLESHLGYALNETFCREPGKAVTIREMRSTYAGKERGLRPEMSFEEVLQIVPAQLVEFAGGREVFQKADWRIIRQRCHLNLEIRPHEQLWISFLLFSKPEELLADDVRGVIHVPALRGNPERTYQVTAIGPTFPDVFNKYAASVLSRWGEQADERLERASRNLAALGLTWKVEARPINDTHIEVRVGRLPRVSMTDTSDVVNIADVGFGVSQVLPVVVALQVAEEGQLVYAEEPEIHLHPKAQVAMAGLLAEAASRGVRVVVESHSALLLLGVQTLVAKGELDPALVKLHWFERDAEGATQVHAGELDEKGRFGDWPQDFGDVELTAEKEYLDTARL